MQAVNQEEPSDRKSDPWPLWMAGHVQLKFVMTECSKTQIRLTGLNCESDEVVMLQLHQYAFHTLVVIIDGAERNKDTQKFRL